MVEVTDADRLAAARFVEDYGWICEDEWSDIHPNDREVIGKFFARHRIAAENAALERAAKVADDYVTYHDKHDDGLSGFDKMSLGASEVAEEIRALKGPSNA